MLFKWVSCLPFMEGENGICILSCLKALTSPKLLQCEKPASVIIIERIAQHKCMCMCFHHFHRKTTEQFPAVKSQCMFSIKKIQEILKSAPNQMICALTRCTKLLGESVQMAFHGLFGNMTQISSVNLYFWVIFIRKVSELSEPNYPIWCVCLRHRSFLQFVCTKKCCGYHVIQSALTLWLHRKVSAGSCLAQGSLTCDSGKEFASPVLSGELALLLFTLIP